MKSIVLLLITAVASAADRDVYEQVRKSARQTGRFVDLCPNAGKCDFSPDQKIGGEIIELDTSDFSTSKGLIEQQEQYLVHEKKEKRE